MADESKSMDSEQKHSNSEKIDVVQNPLFSEEVDDEESWRLNPFNRLRGPRNAFTRLIGFLEPRDVVRLERVDRLLNWMLDSVTVDEGYWRQRYAKKYGNSNETVITSAQSEEEPPNTYREDYRRQRMTEHKEELIQLAKLAEQTGRHDYMAQVMKKIVTEFGVGLTNEERDLLSDAYKNMARASRSLLRAIDKNTMGSEKKQQMAKEFREKIKGELREICYDVLDLLDKFLIPKVASPDAKVFYLKMEGDYYRYLTEVATGDDRITVVEKAHQSYQEAFDIAKEKMLPIDPIRLGLALNFSVFYNDILNFMDKARQLTQQALDAAMTDLEILNEDSYQDSTPIMHMLHENLNFWNSVEGGGEVGGSSGN